MQKPAQSLSRRRQLEERARVMRASPSWPEQVLFGAIRGKRLGVGVKRQVVLGRFIADFVVASHRLVIEVDGPQHALRRAADARRDRALERLGYRVIRASADDVCTRLDSVLARIRAALEA
ncbi:MAG TPA: DUF559 domain-containing protein [Polyangiaceae bacterium]|nr:DUF559 domain-containing protein [Polyangiaceae bacterium]